MVCKSSFERLVETRQGGGRKRTRARAPAISFCQFFLLSIMAGGAVCSALVALHHCQ